jgi:hypothetical protein
MPGIRRRFVLPCTISLTHALIGAVFAAVLVFAAAPAGAATRTFTATADDFVNAVKPHKNYGAAARLRVDGSPKLRSYLKFDVHLPAGAVARGASLKLYAMTHSRAHGFKIRRVRASGWRETRLTYANAPSLGRRLGRSGSWKRAGYRRVALPASAIHVGANSFAITTGRRSGLKFSSRQGAYKPRLEVRYTLADPAPPVTAPDVSRRTPAAATPPPQTPTPGTGATPTGVPGVWKIAFDDEFDGSTLDTSKWSSSWYNGGSMNNVATSAANVTVANGEAKLILSDANTGALIHTDYSAGRYQLPVGGVVEARVSFPGNGGTEDVYNWPAWWASGPSWPGAGEHDIAEGLGGELTVNYHGTSNTQNYGSPAGTWGSGFHTYTLYRKATSADVYWDGQLVKSYPTGDNGAGEELILNAGKSGSRTPVLGDAGAVRVDYVRAWVAG